MIRYISLLLFIGLAFWSCEEDEPEDCAGVVGGDNICGCTDSTASNYDSNATFDDESCEYDTTPPTVTISYPLTNSTVSEMVTINCISSDNEGVEKVELWVNGVTTELTDDSEPYSFDWNTTLVDNGSYSITVRSFDTSENTTDSEPIVLTVDNTQSNPQPVNITSIVFENGGFTITWNESTDGDFDSYELEKSTNSTMNSPSVVFTTDSLEQTIFFDTDVDPLIYQFYRVTVIDTFDYETKGQIVSSSLDPVPSSVNVSSVTYTFEAMTVTWEESVDEDFRDYKLLYSETESGDRDTIFTYTDNSVTSHTITEFDPLIENWFWVQVTDTLGLSSIGTGMTNSLDSEPTPVNITSVTYDLESMTITWEEYVPNMGRINQMNQNTRSTVTNDFVSYELLQSDSEDGTYSSIVVITDQSITSHSITEYDPSQENWFKVKVTDFWGLISFGSGMTNEIDSPPTQIDISSITYDLTEMVVSWNQSSNNDFVSYKLLYSETQGGEQTSITTITDVNTTSYTITDFDPSQERWYWIMVTDYWNLTTVSNGYMVLDSPPTQSELFPIVYENGSFIITWSQNNDDDDFQSYKLYESLSEDMSNQTLVYETNDRTDTNYVVTGVSEDELRYYQLVVEDVWGSQSISNIEDGDSHNWFLRTFGGSDSDYGNSVQQTEDGGYIIAGSTKSFGSGDYDVWVIKANSQGEEEWNQTFGGSLRDYGRSIQQTDDGSYIIVGETRSFGSDDYDVWLIKANSQGEEEWNQTYDDNNSQDNGYSVQQTIDGGYIIVGGTNSSNFYETWIIKTDSQGNQEWNSVYQYGEGRSIKQTTDSGYIIIGNRLFKIDSEGNEEWVNENISGFFVQQTTDGGYIITGQNSSNVSLIKTDSQGNEEWNQIFGGSDSDIGFSVQQTTDGGYIITGYTYSFGNGNTDVWLIKTDSNGETLWTQTFGGSDGDRGYSVQQTTDGGYIIAGSTSSFGNGDLDVLLIKTDSEGNTAPYGD